MQRKLSVSLANVMMNMAESLFEEHGVCTKYGTDAGDKKTPSMLPVPASTHLDEAQYCRKLITALANSHIEKTKEETMQAWPHAVAPVENSQIAHQSPFALGSDRSSRRSAGRPMVQGLLAAEGKPCFILLEASTEMLVLPETVLLRNDDDMIQWNNIDLESQSAAEKVSEVDVSCPGRKGMGTMKQEVIANNDTAIKPKPTRNSPAASPAPGLKLSSNSGKATAASVGDSVYLTAEEVTAKKVKSLMLRNVPPSCGQEHLVAKLIEHGFEGEFDFVYVPFNMSTSTTKGYAFINMVSADAAARLVGRWSGTSLFSQATTCSSFTLKFSPAALQGLEANTRKMLRSKLQRIRNPHFRPYVAPALANTLLSN